MRNLMLFLFAFCLQGTFAQVPTFDELIKKTQRIQQDSALLAKGYPVATFYSKYSEYQPTVAWTDSINKCHHEGKTVRTIGFSVQPKGVFVTDMGYQLIYINQYTLTDYVVQIFTQTEYTEEKGWKNHKVTIRGTWPTISLILSEHIRAIMEQPEPIALQK